MAIIVAIVGAIVAPLGLVGVVSPETMKRVGSQFRDPPAMYAAVAIRLVIGVLLILAGPYCRTDTPWIGGAVRGFGVLVIAAAVALLVIGPHRFRAMIDWGLSKPPPFLRCWSLVALVLGGLLIYAGT